MSNEELPTREIYDNAIGGFVKSLSETVTDMVAEEVRTLDHTQYADAAIDKIMKEDKFLQYMRKAVLMNVDAIIGALSMHTVVNEIVSSEKFAKMIWKHIKEEVTAQERRTQELVESLGGPSGIRSLVIQELPSALEMYFAAEEDSD